MTVPLFDRSELLALLKKRVTGFQAGYRQNMALIGPAGMGKTTLVREFLQQEARNESLLINLHLEISPEESASEWISRFVQTLLYSVLQLRKAKSLPTHLPELVEVCSQLVPRTAALAGRVTVLSEAGRIEEAYDRLWELPHLLTQETGHRVLLVLDEFHCLRGFSVKEPFRSLGQKIMVQSTTMYLLISSEPAVAQSILKEGLALLFGKFEEVEVLALPARSCRKALRSCRPEEGMDPFAEHLLMDLAQGHPTRLNLLLEAWRRIPSSDSGFPDPMEALLDLLEGFFIDPESSMRREFERRLRLLPAHKNRIFSLLILEWVAAGIHRLPQLAQQAQRPVSQVAKALQLLESCRLVQKEGVFYRVPHRLFQAWLMTAYPVLQGVALVNPEEAKAQFRKAAGAWVQGMRAAAERPAEDHLRDLLTLWDDEVVELDGKRALLPKFRQVDRVPGPLERPSLLGRPARKQHKTGWWLVPWSGGLDEAQARQLVQQIRAFAPLKNFRKVLVGASVAEVNARLVLQEAKVRFWDLSVLNQLLELYGLSRLPVPEEADFLPAQMVALQDAPVRAKEDRRSEVSG